MKSNVAVRPTGPPDENYLNAHLYGEEGDVVAPLLGAAFEAYMEEHAPGRKSPHYTDSIQTDFNSLLTATKLHENCMVTAITKAHALQWIEFMRTPRTFPTRKPANKAMTIAQKLGRMRHFL